MLDDADYYDGNDDEEGDGVCIDCGACSDEECDPDCIFNTDDGE